MVFGFVAMMKYEKRKNGFFFCVCLVVVVDDGAIDVFAANADRCYFKPHLHR